MCQLIYKPAGFTIEKRLIESTCIVNPDGFGLMYYDNNSKATNTLKLYNGDNDPDILFPILESLHDQDLFIHFRYRTRGEVNEASCHPFEVYDDNDRKVFLMHNGTISGYGSNTKVDSEEFGEKIVGPLYDKWLKSGCRNPLQDLFFHEIVQKFLGGESKVALLDNTGDSLIFNYAKGDVRKEKITIDGKTEDLEWWVSNTYSFNTSHRKSYSYDYSKYSHNHGGTQNNGTTPFRQNETTQTSHGGTTTTEKTNTPTGGGTSTANTTSVKGKVPVRTMVKSYWQDVVKLDCIDDLASMTRDHISDLVDLEPENAKLLINDLLIELFDNYAEGNDDIDEHEDA